MKLMRRRESQRRRGDRPRLALGAAAVVAVASTLTGGARAARAQEPADDAPAPPREVDPAAVVRDAGRQIRENFYDRELAQSERFERALREAEREVKSRPGGPTIQHAHIVIRKLLASLDASHAGIVPSAVYESDVVNEIFSRPSPRLGLELKELPEGIFVNDLYAGGPAERAGVRVGDRLVSVDGVAAGESPRLLEGGGDVDKPRRVVLETGPPGTRAALGFERRPEPGGGYEVTLAAEPLDLTSATRSSARVVELPDGTRVGKIRFYHLLSERLADALAEAIATTFADADALVVDLRGRGGRPNVVFKVLELLVPGEKRIWHRPVAFVIDHGSRSAKEVFAYHVRDKKAGPLVGENTAGAVLAATFYSLLDGSRLMLPKRDVRDLTQGVFLEGKGVAPDVEVKAAPLPWSEGKDPIMERAIEVAAHRAELEKRGVVPR